MSKLKGQNIVRMYTLNTMYANNTVEIEDDEGNYYRVPVSTIMQMVNDFEFVVKKKRKYNHLVEALPLEEPVQ